MSTAPRNLGPYQVIRSLGVGGMGEVWLAYDPQLDRRVAIKRIRSDASPDEERRARFQREARVAAALNHPAIVQVHHLLTADDADHIVMEYVAGTSLRQHLEARGPLPLAEGLAIARTVAAGLACAHRHGVVHRDLKTENVLLTPDGEAKITDFGIARRLYADAAGARDTSLTRAGTLLGTYRTMSPEHICGDPVNERSDLFSLGVLLYEIFTGKSPFLAATNQETMQRVLRHRPPPVHELAAGLPPELAELIDHLLEKNPLLRPRDAEEVVERLDALAGSSIAARGTTLDGGVSPPATGNVTAPATGGTSTYGPVRRRKGLAAAAVLLVVVAALAWFFRDVVVPPAEPLYVAVMQPQLTAGDPDAATELLTFAIRNALTRTLLSLDGVSPKSTAEVDEAAGDPAAVARVVAADEALVSSLTCQPRNCWVELSRVRADGSVAWSAQTEIPVYDPLVAAQSISVKLLNEAYAGKRPRAGTGNELQISPDDYKSYLEVRQILDTGTEDVTGPLLERAAAIRKRSDRFPDAYLLEAEISLQLFYSTKERGFLDRTFGLIEKAQKLAPGDRAVLLRRVHCETTAGRLAAAEESLTKLERLIPGDVGILQLRAEILSSRGESQRALAVYRTAIGRRPSAGLLINYARLAEQQGEVEAARDAVERHLRLLPDSRRGRRLLGTIELTSGDVHHAISLLEELVATSPTPNDLVLLGLGRLLLHEPAPAAEAFQRAVAAAPNNPDCLLNLADALWLRGDVDEAQRLYGQVLELQDEEAGTPDQLSVRAQALAHLGRSREAASVIQEALLKAPGNRDVAFAAALVYALVGDRIVAGVNAEKAVRLGLRTRWLDLPWFDELRSDPAFQKLLQSER